MTVTLLQQAVVATATVIGLVAMIVSQQRRRRARLAAWRRYAAAHPVSSTAPRGTPGSRRAAVDGNAPVSVPSHPSASGRLRFVHTSTGTTCLRRSDCPRDDHRAAR